MRGGAAMPTCAGPAAWSSWTWLAARSCSTGPTTRPAPAPSRRRSPTFGRSSPPGPITLLTASMADKDVAGVVAALAASPALAGATVVCVAVDVPRALPADDLGRALACCGPGARPGRDGEVGRGRLPAGAGRSPTGRSWWPGRCTSSVRSAAPSCTMTAHDLDPDRTDHLRLGRPDLRDGHPQRHPGFLLGRRPARHGRSGRGRRRAGPAHGGRGRGPPRHRRRVRRDPATRPSMPPPRPRGSCRWWRPCGRPSRLCRSASTRRSPRSPGPRSMPGRISSTTSGAWVRMRGSSGSPPLDACPMVVMHNRAKAVYSDLMTEIVADLRAALDRAIRLGVDPDDLIVDPGFGFGKTAEHNLALLRELGDLRALGRPILLGASRKSTLGLVLDLPADRAARSDDRHHRARHRRWCGCRPGPRCRGQRPCRPDVRCRRAGHVAPFSRVPRGAR